MKTDQDLADKDHAERESPADSTPLSPQSFLYGGHKTGINWPDTQIMLGVDFEIGGCHEDYGFGVYLVEYVSPSVRPTVYTKRCIASGRTLQEAIIKARKHFEDEPGSADHV